MGCSARIPHDFREVDVVQQLPDNPLIMSIDRGQETSLAFRLKGNILSAAGHTAPDLRRAIASYVASITVDDQAVPDSLPSMVASLVRNVALHAYKVTDDDIAVLKRADYSDDAIFEVIVTAAVAAGVARLDIGLALAREEP